MAPVKSNLTQTNGSLTLSSLKLFINWSLGPFTLFFTVGHFGNNSPEGPVPTTVEISC